MIADDVFETRLSRAGAGSKQRAERRRVRHTPDALESPISLAGNPTPPAPLRPRAAHNELGDRVPRRGRVRAAFVLARPRQWIKNGLVVAAAGAAGALGHDDIPVRIGFACLAFCLISAGIDALNDTHDAAEDRRHPHKRYRPVAARELEPRRGRARRGMSARRIDPVLRDPPPAGGGGLGYVALTLSYTLVWRHILVLDIVAVAGGFLLRARRRAVARPPVALSRWFVLVVAAAALFVAAGRRQCELRRTSGQRAAGGEGVRRVLYRYSPGGLGLLLAGSGACAVFAYRVWPFALPDIDGFPWRLLTVIPFTACLLRYGALVRNGGGEAREEMLLSDRWLVLGGGVAAAARPERQCRRLTGGRGRRRCRRGGGDRRGWR